MKLIRLTQVPHPDIAAGEVLPIYIDADRVASIERGRIGYAKEGSLERVREAYQAIGQTIDNIYAAAKEFTFDDLLGQPQKFAAFREAVTDYGQAVQASPRIQSEHYPRQDCTYVRYGLGPKEGVYEWGCLFVQESPEEVARLVSFACGEPTFFIKDGKLARTQG